MISIRARRIPGDDLIHYRVVGEYEDSPYSSVYEIEPESSAAPLTQGELIGLTDTTNGDEGGGLGLVFNRSCVGGASDARSLRHLTTLSSTIYRQASQPCRQAAQLPPSRGRVRVRPIKCTIRGARGGAARDQHSSFLGLQWREESESRSIPS